MKTCPHSVHSLRAANNFCNTDGVIFITSRPEVSEISLKAATPLATTLGLESEIKSWRVSMKPRSWTRSGAMSKSLATHTAAVFRTYYGLGEVRVI